MALLIPSTDPDAVIMELEALGWRYGQDQCGIIFMADPGGKRGYTPMIARRIANRRHYAAEREKRAADRRRARENVQRIASQDAQGDSGSLHESTKQRDSD